jgi:MFS family permease
MDGAAATSHGPEGVMPGLIIVGITIVTPFNSKKLPEKFRKLFAMFTGGACCFFHDPGSRTEGCLSVGPITFPSGFRQFLICFLFGEKRVVQFSLISSSISLILLLLPANFYYLLSVTIFFFSFTAMLRPALSTWLSKMAGSEQGFAAGISNAYTSLAIIIGPAFAGILFDIHIALPCLCGAILILASLAIPIQEKPAETVLPIPNHQPDTMRN